MAAPQPTGYGWLIRMPDGSLLEAATDSEALEQASEDDDD